MIRLAIALQIIFATVHISRAADEVHRWDMPLATTGVHEQTALSFAECVFEATEGRIAIAVRGGSEMLKGRQILPALKAGKVQIGERRLSAHAAEHPIFGIDSVPFLATSFADSAKLAAAADPMIQGTLKAENLHFLYSVPWPPQSLSLNREIGSFSDMRGVKVRAYDTRTARFAELTGMTPTHIDIGEISQGVATGVWEALITSAKTVVDRNLWELGLSHHYRINAWLPRNSVMINLDTWRALDGGSQTALSTCGAAAAEHGARLSKEQNEATISAMRDAGMVVVAPDADLMTDLAERVGKPMIAEWLKTAGDDGAMALSAFHSLSTPH